MADDESVVPAKARFSARDQRLILELKCRGVSPDGAEQVAAEQIVTSLNDRLRLKQIVAAAAAQSDASDDSIFVATSADGSRKTLVSTIGELRLMSTQPMEIARDRRGLAKVLARLLVR
jgi:hypothetical protein